MKQEELKKLLDTMSLQEKIDQMLQLTGDFYQDADSVLTGPAVQLGVTGEDVRMAAPYRMPGRENREYWRCPKSPQSVTISPLA